jgi:hypothetical protein
VSRFLDPEAKLCPGPWFASRRHRILHRVDPKGITRVFVGARKCRDMLGSDLAGANARAGTFCCRPVQWIAHPAGARKKSRPVWAAEKTRRIRAPAFSSS